ncbi:MAG: elongation factor Ts [Ignavibacteria bacterium]|nr:elongation factor Ts [Ignavibacteria bacterium]MBK6420437.1 elongation factor Ts [Ignavibacteria bacterium]MBK6761602.1 elongation factor Ts [Ignavibacteria bacterium]MBK7033634.1 elongation factor Ts [Ignavibacteria bacterium]MBK7412613.1 elongation factor Ts [Ignavibacteria bacterium]
MISAQTVKELREKTGAGMADCKKALEEAAGDMQAAIDWLRKRGAASVAKRADRDANEGIVVVKTSADGKTAAIVEVNCETDFVARNDEFVAFATAICDAILAQPITSEDQLWTIESNGKTLGNLRDEILAKFSEKIGLRRYERIATNGRVMEYTHAGSRLGVLVEFDGAAGSDEIKPLTRDVAMQVAAMQPMFVDRSQVNQEVLAKELEIYKQQAIEEGKKEDIAERVAQGRLGKFYEEQVLIEQTFVKDPSKKVSDIVAEIGKLSGGDVKVVSFVRYNLGDKV